MKVYEVFENNKPLQETTGLLKLIMNILTSGTKAEKVGNKGVDAIIDLQNVVSTVKPGTRVIDTRTRKSIVRRAENLEELVNEYNAIDKKINLLKDALKNNPKPTVRQKIELQQALRKKESILQMMFSRVKEVDNLHSGVTPRLFGESKKKDSLKA